MQDRILALLGIAARAGKIVSGGFSAEEAVTSRKARLVIIAKDAKNNTIKKFTDKCSFYKIPVCFYGSKDTLGHAVGREDRACVAVTDRGLAESIERLLEDLGKGGCDGNEDQ